MKEGQFLENRVSQTHLRSTSFGIYADDYQIQLQLSSRTNPSIDKCSAISSNSNYSATCNVLSRGNLRLFELILNWTFGLGTRFGVWDKRNFLVLGLSKEGNNLMKIVLIFGILLLLVDGNKMQDLMI